MTPAQRNAVRQMRKFLDRAERYHAEGKPVEHIGRQMEKHIFVLAKMTPPIENERLFRLFALALKTIGVSPNQFLRALNEHLLEKRFPIDDRTWELLVREITRAS